MATAIQLLRSAVPNLRPDPGVLADGMPMVNLAEEEPGMYLRLTSGALVKIGPAHVGTAAPNSSPAGFSGNSKGEIWVDTTNPAKVSLKVWEGTQWIEATSDPSVISPTPPTSPEGGDLWFDTANGILQYWNGTEWVPITNTPAAGANQEVQFNNVGEFGSDSTFTFSSFEKRLTVDKFTANEASITELGASDITTVDLQSTTATLTGALTAQGATFGSNVVVNGDVTAVNATLSGNFQANSLTSATFVNANSAEITEGLTAKEGTFSGNVTAANFLINTLPSLP
jgi:hypothetical protein